MKELIFALTVIFSSLACAGCQKIETTSYVSPDGSLVAKLLDDRGGGAATSAYQTVELVSRASGAHEKVFSGENMGGRATQKAPFGDLNVSWRDNRTLMIEYCGGDVDDRAPQANVDGKIVNVIVSQEQRGPWPASMPNDRRAGPPPCL